MSNLVIQSLDRGLKILQILGRTDRALSLNEITEHFSIDRSSVFRLIATLIQNDFVRQDPETKKYRLGYKVMEIAGAYGEQSSIETIIRPIMQRVCGETKQNTHLAVLDGKEVVFIAVEQPRDSLSVHVTVGTREPAGATALGKALLSSLDEENIENQINEMDLKKYTEKTITSPKKMKSHILQVKTERIAVDNEEYKGGIICFAAPVLNNRGEAPYSIGISGSRDLIKPRFDEYKNIVKNAGIEASEQLGHG